MGLKELCPMAVDNLETEYHLTPNGWVVGTSYLFGKTEKHVNPPVDRALTLVEKIYQASRWTPEESSSWEQWRSPKASAEEIATLMKKFPSPIKD